MRTHQQIIVDANGPTAVAKAIGADVGLVKQWRRLDSVPAPYWNVLADRGIATLEELAEAAEARRLERSSAKQGASDEDAAA